ncbi:MAG: DNA-binding protein [Lachnospiraceae bacterium]|nr:DNA-binding protein [Lachnospiraceae bacterium]
MEKMVRQALLYDFYGELLTEHQKSIYSDIVLNDLSYSEVARAEGISRQGVFDLVKRCDKILEDYESKLLLVEKFLNTKNRVSRIHDLAARLKELTDREELLERISEIEEISRAIYESY